MRRQHGQRASARAAARHQHAAGLGDERVALADADGTLLQLDLVERRVRQQHAEGRRARHAARRSVAPRWLATRIQSSAAQRASGVQRASSDGAFEQPEVGAEVQSHSLANSATRSSKEIPTAGNTRR